ncbi:efflux RND transporter periplasmic adaptor subunit [Desulfoprunum benzoelyticum]|uniref:Cu(I)/Ag(I) efflux system membrane fusion protein/cobalt-zinc-cadmium efflux system membrane fusion protein n=1 Tax=Desulfoprunum benzoelyticum TaxID=1506996 RepID=A0A840UMA2_9BACT|nr:efflux RND transporter periplasmic adaptor subunit [Desulfoprunum benzoelyticum]MBB5347417.1 Cu(I)/Ag(I) efflux system membrane fusion protein/cobalt-zinc-cadmium efflux system membrane fusion protein [Desulfoprunum benzoelyticum]MBM9529703.1 efflux RND transporter periplasmic adaptor subunit [Desulfoprunum benzoelyticum]
MKILKILVLIVVVIVAATGGYQLGVQRQHDHEQPGPGQGATVEQKQQYTCSMHPFIIRDAPGNCPICGMALVPLKPGAGGAAVTEDESGAGIISIDPTTAQNMGVRTEAVSRRKLVKTVRTVGLLTYAEGRQFSVNSKIEGWIEKLYVNQEGQTVKKGQPLLAIYSPELVAAQQEYLLALDHRRRLAGSPVPGIAASAERLLAAARTRLQYWDISPGQIKAIEQAGRITKTLTLFSPHSGIVTGKKALQGMRVMAGEELLQIADISTVWINAEIYEHELPWVRVGQRVRVELPFAAGRTYEAKIAYIYPYLNNDTRTARARIELANPGLELKPDMYANVSIDTAAVDGALAVPVNAVLSSGKGRTVFVARGDGRFEPRPVTSGLSDDNGYIQILSGLEEGEAVVVSAQFMLDSESTLREALQKMTAPPGVEGRPAETGKASGAPADGKGTQSLDDLFK